MNGIQITIQPSDHGYYVIDQHGRRCGFLSTSRTMRAPDERGYDRRDIRPKECAQRVTLPRLH